MRRCLSLLAAVLVLAGCGTRVDRAELRTDAGGGEVALSARSIERVRTAVVDALASVTSAAPVATAAAPSTHALPAVVHRGFTRAPMPAPVVRRVVDPGCPASAAPVVLGQVGNFSGLIGPLTAAARTTTAAWVKDINARGGLACHQVVLYQRDDGAEPARSAAAVAELVSEKHAVAILGAFVPLSVVGLASAADRAKVPVIGGDGLTGDWDDSPYLYRQGAGLAGQAGGLMTYLVAQGARKMGWLYCVETTSCAAARGTITSEATRAGADLVIRAPVSASQPEYTAACQNAKSAGVQALLLALDGASIGRVARSCAALGYRPILASTGGVIGAQQATDPALRAETFATTSLTAPWTLTDSPGQRAFHAALARWAPGTEPDSNALSAWASGLLLEHAINGLGPAARTEPLTTTMVLSGLATVRSDTLDGLAPPLTFISDRSRERQPRCVFLEVLTTQGWTTPRGNRMVCT